MTGNFLLEYKKRVGDCTSILSFLRIVINQISVKPKLRRTATIEFHARIGAIPHKNLSHLCTRSRFDYYNDKRFAVFTDSYCGLLGINTIVIRYIFLRYRAWIGNWFAIPDKSRTTTNRSIKTTKLDKFICNFHFTFVADFYIV